MFCIKQSMKSEIVRKTKEEKVLIKFFVKRWNIWNWSDLEWLCQLNPKTFACQSKYCHLKRKCVAVAKKSFHLSAKNIERARSSSHYLLCIVIVIDFVSIADEPEEIVASSIINPWNKLQIAYLGFHGALSDTDRLTVRIIGFSSWIAVLMLPETLRRSSVCDGMSPTVVAWR